MAKIFASINGKTGKGILESGYVYAPYVPVLLEEEKKFKISSKNNFEEVIFNVYSKSKQNIKITFDKDKYDINIVDFSSKKSLYTRYSKQLINGSYYGVVTVTDLE